MTTLFHRPYAGDADRDRMAAFLTEAAQLAGPLAGYYHPGDLIWKLFMHPETDPAGTVELWHDDSGRLIGFAWLDPPDLVDVALHPNLLAITPVIAQMVTWAEAAISRRAADAGTKPPAALRLDIPTVDAALAAALTDLGFRDTGDDLFVILARELLDLTDITATDIMVHDMAGATDEDLRRRVALHREVWHPSRVTRDGYRHMRSQPVYRPDLDLVALAPDGDFAAYCICWLDPKTRVGEYEPVGTSLRHRRQGYAAAVMAEGLRRLQALGATRATVGTGADNTAALALYASLGFREAVRYREWNRVIGVRGQGLRDRG